MKIFVKSSFQVLVLTTFLKFEQTTGRRMMFPDGKNHIYLERATCRSYPGIKTTFDRCQIRNIDRNNLKIDILINVSEPVDDVWLHGAIYYKYNTWQKLGTEYWDNLCDWIAGRSFSFFLDFYRFVFVKYTNLNHGCPYNGSLYIKVDNVSLQDFAFPQIAPAGRYRLDLFFVGGNRTTIIGSVSMYGSISDHRVEVV